MATIRQEDFSKDHKYRETAQRVAGILWDSTGGDLSKVPQEYLASLEYTYSDGRVSMLPLLNKLDLPEGAEFTDFVEAIEELIAVDPNHWPLPEFVESIPHRSLEYEIEDQDYDFNEDEFEFAEGKDFSDKVELFLKKVISSVYLDGITSITDKDGNPPSLENNYLMDKDEKAFRGIFYDAPPSEKAKKFPFVLSAKSGGKWQIRY